MKEQTQITAKINQLMQTQGYGPNHKIVQQARAELDLVTKSLDIAAEAARKKYVAFTPDLNGTGGDMVANQRTLDSFKQREAYFQKQYDIVHQNAMEMGATQQNINRYRDEMAKLKEDMDALSGKIQSLEWQRATGGNIKPQFGNEPMAPTVDKRKQFAAVGFAGGGFLPIALMLVIGLLDSRYRYSDDAGGQSSMSGLTLLGILPNLPDRLSDPTQASIAAHCVHQIRTMLQINGHDDRRAFCVTSAASGDGKTSLTLALGLSFAASGSRTLLIDADLVGAGLTQRLNMNGPEGILEAMTNRDLLPYVRSTDISDLAILPVGLAQLHHAGIFSPAAVRRLINEAKKHYEVVLIDTGPILGSIEATPVCASADGVILTVARGQQRPLVEKALDHLKGIGARVAGVVFNRAQAKDFESSISGISLRSASRSASNGHGHNREGGQFGPIARAVASSVKPTDGDKN
jgi:capsular exopolysaccharide synthesis family protein